MGMQSKPICKGAFLLQPGGGSVVHGMILHCSRRTKFSKVQHTE